MFFPILFFISSTSLEQQCSERRKYELAKTAEKCFQKFFAQIDLSNACTQTNCETNLSKCHNPDYIGSMRKYFHEKAIYYKWWLILSKKLLGDPLSESVFYFFSPFLLQYCSEAGRLSSGQEYFNECMHVKVRPVLQIKRRIENLHRIFSPLELSWASGCVLKKGQSGLKSCVIGGRGVPGRARWQAPMGSPPRRSPASS